MLSNLYKDSQVKKYSIEIISGKNFRKNLIIFLSNSFFRNKFFTSQIKSIISIKDPGLVGYGWTQMISKIRVKLEKQNKKLGLIFF